MGFEYLKNALVQTDPKDLAAAHPWVPANKASLSRLENASNEELQAAGILMPPFHPGCRTVVTKVGEVDTSVVTFTPVELPPQVIEETVEAVVEEEGIDQITEGVSSGGVMDKLLTAIGLKKPTQDGN